MGYRKGMTIGSVLLSAGIGRRLRPLTEAAPKPALPVLDVPLAAFGLADLMATASPVVVNVSHLGDRITRALEDYIGGVGWRTFVEKPEGFGTAGTLAALADSIDARVVIRNADTFSDLRASDVLETHRAASAPVTLAVAPVDGGGDLTIEGGRAASFVDRRREPDVAGHRYLGIAVLEREVVESIPSARPLGLGESVFKDLVAAGDVAVHVHDGYHLDVGTVERFLIATRDALEGRGPQPPKGWPGTITERSAYIGPGARVAPGSVGPGGVVLAGAEVEEDARVERAIVWRAETVPAGTLVSDCVWFEGRAVRPVPTERD